MESRNRAFTFTLNNYTDDDILRLSIIEVVYLVYGREVSESGTPHLQGYIYFKNPRRLTDLRKLFKWHIQSSKANATTNYIYCSKENQYERGKRPLTDEQKGDTQREIYKRTRQQALLGDFDNIDDTHYIRHYSTIKRIHKEDGRKKPEHLPENDHYGYWFYGPPRTGKSTKARTDFPDAYLKDKNKWWDGYDNQEHVIIDEVGEDDKWLTAFLKKWVDRWTFSAEYKGGTMIIRPKLFIITSNYHPSEIFTGVDLEAIESRFKTILFKKNI